MMRCGTGGTLWLAAWMLAVSWWVGDAWAAPGAEARSAARLARQGTELWQQERDLGQAVDLLQEAHALEPGNAEYASTLGRCLLDAGKHGEAEKALLQALALRPAGWVEAWSRLGLGEIRQGRGDEAAAREQYLRVRSLAATSNSTREAAGRLEMLGWTRLARPHFIFWAPPGGWASRHLAENAVDLEKAWSAITGFLQTRPPGPVTVFMFDHRAQAKQLLGIELGMARPGKRQVYLLYGERERQTTGHEIAHVISFYMGRRVTSVTLLREGLAVCLDQSGRNPHQAAADLLAAGEFIGLQRLLTDFRSCPERPAYAEAGSLVRFLVDAHGLDRFRRLWEYDDFSRGLQAVYGMSPTQLEAAWRRHLAEALRARR